MGQVTLIVVRDGLVRDRSGDSQGGPRRVGEPSGRSVMGRGTLREVRDGSGDPRGGPGRVRISWGGQRWVRGSSGRSGQVAGPLEWSGMGCGTLK